MAERILVLPVLTARQTTSIGREVSGVKNFTSDNYQDSGEIYSKFGDKWLAMRNAIPDYFAEELDRVESTQGY